MRKWEKKKEYFSFFTNTVTLIIIIIWDFNLQTEHLIPARGPDLIIINKKKENL